MTGRNATRVDPPGRLLTKPSAVSCVGVDDDAAGDPEVSRKHAAGGQDGPRFQMSGPDGIPQ